MTNGEKIQEIFPNANIKYHEATELVDEHITVLIDDCNMCQDYPLYWWNAEYKEPTTKNDLGVAYIKKSDAINIIQDMHGLARADVISDAVNRIITMSSVTPQEPRKGHWIRTGYYYEGAYDSRDYVECSCCHEDSLEEGDFCPNCGADMRGVEE